MSKQQLHSIVAPHEHDVLSGRGNFVNYHIGNEHFRNLVRKHKVPYVACPKPQKGKFSRMIVEEIRCRTPPGRFLKQDPATKLWYEIGEKKALDKTRQALREGAPDIVKDDIPGEENDSPEEGEDEPTSPPLAKRTSPHQHPVPLQQQAQQQTSMSQMPEQHHPQAIGGTNMGRYHSYDGFSALQHSTGPTPIGLNTSSHRHSTNNVDLRHSNNNDLNGSAHRHNNNNDLNGSSLHSFSSVGPTPIGLNTSLHRHSNNNELNGSSVHSQQQNGMNLSIQHFSPIGLNTSLHRHNNNNDLNSSSVHSQHQNGMNPSGPQHLSGQHNGNGMMLPSSQVGMSGPSQFPGSSHGMQALQQQQQQQLNQQQMGQQHMGQQQMNQQQMNQQQMNQHQQESLDQHSQHSQHSGAARQVMPPSGMNAQGGNNMHAGGGGGGYTEIDIIQNKLLSLSQSQSQHSTYHDQFEPRPIDPNLVATKSPPEKEDYVENESERMAPLPSRREPRKTPNKRNYKREGSDSSLQVDTIFPNVQQSSSNQSHNNNANNANNLSVMSLSISEMNHGSSDHNSQQRAEPHQDHQQRAEPPNNTVQPESLTAMFNNSMRFSGERKKAVRRSGSNDEESSVKGLNLDMSVATLGDHMSEMGEMSYARMNEDSQANMSFSNVFEETERDLYVNGG